MKICVDAGHSGHGIDPGAVGQSGLCESDIALQVSLILEQLALSEGHETLMTRRTESDRASDSLRYRTEMSNEWGADVFVSIHCNAAENREAQGTETFYFPFSPNGRVLADRIQENLVAMLGRPNRGVKPGNLWVIRYTNCPAVLVELAFISNPEEETLLADSHFQYNAAQAIWRGVKSYLGIDTTTEEKPLESNPTQSSDDWSDAGLRNKLGGS